MTEIVDRTDETAQAPGAPPAPYRRNRLFVFGIIALFVAGGAVAFFFFVLPRIRGEAKQTGTPEATKKTPTVQLVEGKPETLYIPESVRKSLGIEGTYKVEAPTNGKPLTVPGSTALDPTRIRRMRIRFPAEVVSIAQVDVHDAKSDRTTFRDIRSGDTVKEKEELAVIWSAEVGLRKSDLADAIVQLRLDEQRLKDRLELWKNGALPLDTLNQTRHDVIVDQNAVDRAERQLLVWNVPQAEIDEVIKVAEADAKNVSALQTPIPKKEKEERFKRWARSAIVAPISGTIIESNIGGKGEFLADNTVNLLTIADVDRLQVLAYPSEDQLPVLTALKQNDMQWTIRTVGADPIPAHIDDISYILDPNTRTPVVKGYIDNPGRKLRAGQFVIASVKMRPPEGVVEIPLSALAEDGRQSFAFVQVSPKGDEYTMRRVQVTRRFEETAYVHNELTAEDRKANAEDQKQGLPPRQALAADDQILTAGVLELRSALEDMMSKKTNAK